MATGLAFADEHPKIPEVQRVQELRNGDWLRVWSPGREQILLTGTVHASDGRAALHISNRPLRTIASWFDRKFPAECAPL